MKRISIKDLNANIGNEVILFGWVDVRRDHGKLIFIDLRDATGKVQMVALPSNKEAHKMADSIRPEWVIEVNGVIGKRPEKMINKDILNGDIEIEIKGLEVLSRAETPPFDLAGDGYEISEEQRLIYRYLDLRRPRLYNNLKKRSEVMRYIRNFLSDRDFVEIETPQLSKSTPEGARDFIVPSRLDNGKFYALPQSPQQYKQLLMVAGIERYFQIARCMRDEDTRGDRQAEFTQLDLEMSFVDREDIMGIVEELYTLLVESLYKDKKITQKPWPRISYKESVEKYGSDRPDLRKDKTNPDELAFVWIIDFPLFEEDKSGKHYAPSHHMFTSPMPEDMEKLESDPGSVRSLQYDISLNGNEIAGGSIRIHDGVIQKKIFELIGFDSKDKENFDHMLRAFTYGVPPHGGIASGLDRLISILQNEPNIREVIAFPKTGEGRDLMMDAPSSVKEEALDDLGIQIKKE